MSAAGGKSGHWILVSHTSDIGFGRTAYWSSEHFSTRLEDSALFPTEKDAKRRAETMATAAIPYRITVTPGVGELGKRLASAASGRSLPA